MRAPLHGFPCWLAILPGIAAGWLLGRGSPAESLVDPMTSPLHSRNAVTADRLGNRSPAPPHLHATAGRAKIRLEPAKIRRLRDCHRLLKLDVTSFDGGTANPSTESAFEILRDVLDLAPGEETALRKHLIRGAEALRTYERTHVTAFSASDGRISFQLPPAGKFHEELAGSINRSPHDILGEERAAIFEAITGIESFCGIPRDFGGAIEFRANPADRSIETLVDYEQVQITWISQPATAAQPEVFGRFGHLIDAESRRRFLEAAFRHE